MGVESPLVWLPFMFLNKVLQKITSYLVVTLALQNCYWFPTDWPSESQQHCLTPLFLIVHPLNDLCFLFNHSTKKWWLLPFPFCPWPLISFSHNTDQGSSKRINKDGEWWGRSPHLVPDLNANVPRVFPLKVLFVVGYSG